MQRRQVCRIILKKYDMENMIEEIKILNGKEIKYPKISERSRGEGKRRAESKTE